MVLEGARQSGAQMAWQPSAKKQIRDRTGAKNDLGGIGQLGRMIRFFKKREWRKQSWRAGEARADF